MECRRVHTDTRKHGVVMDEEDDETVGQKKIKYGDWKKESSIEAQKEYKKNRQNATIVIASAKDKKQKACASDLNDSEHQNDILAKQTVKGRQNMNLINPILLLVRFIIMSKFHVFVLCVRVCVL